MKKIVIIGANSFQNKLILKAKQRGYQTHVFAWKCGDVGEFTADFFYPISITEKEKILDECKKIKPDAIISIASDLAMITVNYVARELNLTCNSELCTMLTTNKFKMRTALKKGLVKTPLFCICSKANYQEEIDKIACEFIDNNKVAIVKPTDRSGSRGITKIASKEAIKTALNDAFEQSFSKTAIIEEYIDGDEYSCECISYNGEHHFLAITKKFTTGSPHFIETGHIQPSGLDENTIKTVVPMIFKALTALNITNGASHTEFKIGPNKDFNIIEIGARMGGDCIGSDLVRLSTGYDFLGMVLDVALGEKPNFETSEHYNTAQINFIFNDDDLEKLNKIKEENPKSIYFVSDIEKIGSRSVVDSSTRFGYYITVS